eukprot:5640396-Ditylum_brightwellii.AAC.1
MDVSESTPLNQRKHAYMKSLFNASTLDEVFDSDEYRELNDDFLGEEDSLQQLRDLVEFLATKNRSETSSTVYRSRGLVERGSKT